MMKDQPTAVKSIPDRVYDTPGLRVERYWYRHPLRAFALMRALMIANNDPYEQGWPEIKSVGRSTWTPAGRYEFKISAEKPMFRKPPMPYLKGCPMCGQKRYNLGWHTNWDGKGESSRGKWHAACRSAYLLMTKPSEFSDFFIDLQDGLCAISGILLEDAKRIDIDHIIPLYRVYRDYSHLQPEQLVQFWGPRNLRAISNKSHKKKNIFEAAERAGRFT